MDIPSNLPNAGDVPEEGTAAVPNKPMTTDPIKMPEKETRDILAAAIKNQAEDGPRTRRAAIRTYNFLLFFPSHAYWLSPGHYLHSIYSVHNNELVINI